MAASISLRSYLLVTPTKSSRECVTLAFPDISLDHTWYLDELPFDAFKEDGHRTKYAGATSSGEPITALDPVLVEALQPHITNVSPHLPEKVRKQHHVAALCFLYILLSLDRSNNTSGCIYTMRSTIPIGAGLGSSASISVCLATAILIQRHHISGPTSSKTLTPTDSQKAIENHLDVINRWAFVGELCIHGNPSGVDNTVATKGKAVLFKRTKPGQNPLVRAMHDFPVLPLLLVDTKQSRSTAVEVAKVGALRKAHPEVADLILDAIDKITESAHELVSSEDFKADDPQSLQKIGELIRINHGLLVALGVSHPKLERVRELIDQADIGYTKLTGAGGGGCAITLVQPSTTPDMLHQLERRLEDEGFAKYETTLGGAGVGLREYIKFSQESFLNAETSDDIEALVQAGKAGFADEWQFWDIADPLPV